MHIVKLTIFICALTLLVPVMAQQNTIGFYGTVSEYIGDLNNNTWNVYRFKHVYPNPAVALEQYISPSVNFVETLSYDWVQYQTPDLTKGVHAQILNLNLKLKYKLNNDFLFYQHSWFAPFFVVGGGASYIKSRPFINGLGGNPLFTNGIYGNLAAGVGIRFQINKIVNFEIGSTANMPLYDGWDGVGTKSGDIWSNDVYLQHSAGFVFNLSTREDSDHDGVVDARDRCPNTPRGVTVDKYGCPIDTDGDGIPDYLDRCPYVFGLRIYQGCPDRDNDGVPDVDDACPDVPGLKQYKGCPASQPKYKQENRVIAEADSDGDGVPDSRDKCPNTPRGTQVDANGCPLINNTDSDGDGIPDRLDRCPNSKGPESNRGCPEIKVETKKRLQVAIKGIYFETAKSDIKPQSYPNLNEVISILNEYPDYSLRVGGHTDNVGGDAYNLGLSQRRMNAVKAFLITKGGIAGDRIEATGYGKSRPVAPNTTPAGRALNRRVEMDLFLK